MAGDGRKLKYLVDTGANKNFLKPDYLKYSQPVEKPFTIKSAGGNIQITRKVKTKIFKEIGNNTDTTFFILPGLESFDGIIGDDTLKEVGAVIDRKNHLLIITPGIKIPLKQKTSMQVNNISVRDEHLPDQTKKKLQNLIKDYKELFGPINNQEIKTSVEAEIRTKTDEPIYSKIYPYPVHMRAEVDSQIKKLLQDGIIRPSKSPYNSPIWVVEKKLDASGIKKYRMVVDYKKLNAVTISDTYPIPDISNTIANLNKSKFFTTVDLTSGFHQIKMKKEDIPKTAFSTLNGKFEYLRLPFGLKNAPSIFQRMIDDVLKDLIGRTCYVYIDDIIIFGGNNAEEHLRNVKEVFERLQRSNLRVNLDKTEFLKSETEFLGYIITNNGIKPNPSKVAAINNIKPPANLKELKSFLGLASYYRRFIRNFAHIAKPLTNLTRGENAQVSANKSKNVKIELKETELKAFKELKDLLSSSEILAFPDFEKPFILTTDASDHAIGAVLSQGQIGKDRPITYISRSLNKSEENYATNWKEMLAIVWALENLRNYLYGAKHIKIITDHQPLTFAMSPKNNRQMLKRWKASLEEYNHELIFRPGVTNKVADALSRLPTEVNAIESSQETEHSADEDNTDLIPHVEAPINVFKNQLILTEGKNVIAYESPHPGFHRHYVSLPTFPKEFLIEILKEKLHPTIINGIKIPEKYINLLQDIVKDHFRNSKIRITQRIVQDVQNEENIFQIIQHEHRRAHRNHKENREQILEKFYFPKMTSLIKKYTKECEICNKNKYDRHPHKPHRQETPIATYPTEIVHIDIFEIANEKYISCIDKFSKFSKFFHIDAKTVLPVREKLIEIIHFFTIPKMLIMDNEPSFISPLVQDYIKTLGIEIYLTPSQKSEVNGTVEKVHSTITEIIRCLKNELKELSMKELVNVAVDRYNNTFHSITHTKPSDIFFGRESRINYQNLLNFREKINEDLVNRLRQHQQKNLRTQNKKRKQPKSFQPGETIFTAVKQIQSKIKPKFTRETVAQDNTVTVTTSSGRKIHKSHIKNIN
jgi:hypothetical protein